MSSRRRDLAANALFKAEQVRRSSRIGLGQPASVIDLAGVAGLQVRFDRLPGLDGLYDRERRLILLSSLRPAGRQAFTCAHELGHHMFGHGQSVLLPQAALNSLIGVRMTDDEHLADRFASFLLMPKIAVKSGFKRRGWKPECARPEQVYAVAGWLGVGYATLVHHMGATLGMLEKNASDHLLSSTPRHIRKCILGAPFDGDLFIVDQAWTGRAVDTQVGDMILAPAAAQLEGEAVKALERTPTSFLYSAQRAGLARLELGNEWAAFIRVSKREYVGLGAYRHWPDPDEEAADE